MPDRVVDVFVSKSAFQPHEVRNGVWFKYLPLVVRRACHADNKRKVLQPSGALSVQCFNRISFDVEDKSHFTTLFNMIEVPNPSEYAISPKFGFLSPDPPAKSFRDPYYQPWDSIAPNLSSLIKSGQLDAQIDKIPILSTDRLTDEVEYRRAYVILAFLTHGHVWQNNNAPNERIPPQISEPFLKVCEYLGMEPVVSYSGLGNWNWQIRNGGGMELENLDTIASFTGTRGEAAFYHLGVLVEYHGGHLTHLLINAIRAASIDDRTTVLRALNETSQTIVRMGNQFPKLHGVLDATLFYHEHRPFM